MNTNLELLFTKLDKFIKKYYLNQMLRGTIIAATVIFFSFILLTVLHYFNYYPVKVKTIIFYVYLAVAIIVIADLIILPLIKYFKLTKTITYKQASYVIANYFTDIKDKLLNILELSKHENQNMLVMASIDQKINQIKIFNFAQVINLKENIKYLKYFLLPLIIFISFVVFKPNIINEGTYRFFNYSTEIQPELPFKFDILNDSMTIRKGEDFNIELAVTGSYVPKEVYIKYSNSTFLMKNEPNQKTKFYYTIKNINNNLNLSFEADALSSTDYLIEVLAPPVILDFNVTITPPTYTNEEVRTLKNVGDLIVPAGTQVTWNFKILNIDTLNMIFTDSINSNILTADANNIIKKQILKSVNYKILATNQHFKDEEILNYNITTIPDLFPNIKIDNAIDTANFSLYYFRGNINDDYGFSKLTFNYALINDQNETIKKFEVIPIELESAAQIQDFYYYIDFKDIKKNYTIVKYYFEVFDNDKINGAKSTKSTIYEFAALTFEQIAEKTDTLNKNIASNANKANKLINEIQNDIENFKKKSLSETMSEWEQQNFVEQILQKQQTLEELLDEMKQKNEELLKNQTNFNEENQELMDKQKMLQELWEQLMTDELKELMKQLEEMQNAFDKEMLKKLTEKMELSYKDLSKQMDRDMQLLKQMQVEQKVDNVISELENLAEKMDELSEQSKEAKSDLQEIKDKQTEYEKDFENAMEEYKQAVEENKELDKPNNLQDFQEDEQSIEQDLSESKESMEQNNKRKTSKSQKSAADKMKQMSQEMQAMMEENQEEQAEEDEENLKQILANLINFSFAQEELIAKTKTSYVNDLSFNDIIKEQQNMEKDFKIINDSLYALAKRVVQINSMVTKNLTSINQTLTLATESMINKKISASNIQQQLIMTKTNDLALLLDEILDQMQNQQGGGGGSGSKKKKPSEGKPSLSDMKGKQESMKKQLEQMLNDMKNGEMNGQTMNKKLAQMLAEQEMFEQMMQEMLNNAKLSPENSKLLKEINKYSEELKKDIINKNITPESLIRQQEIMTRLLEAEKSENERELEEKRESKEAKEYEIINPKDFFDKEQNKDIINEYLERNTIKMKNYYKNKYEEYINNF